MTETQNPEVSVPRPLGSVLVEADYTAFLYNKSQGEKQMVLFLQLVSSRITESTISSIFTQFCVHYRLEMGSHFSEG